MSIVFISAFFIFFVFDASLGDQVRCLMDFDADCENSDPTSVMVSLGLIVMFLTVAIITVYIIVTTAMSDTTSF